MSIQDAFDDAGITPFEAINVMHLVQSLADGTYYEGLESDAVRAVDFMHATLVTVGEMDDDGYDLDTFADQYRDPPRFVTTPHRHD